MTDFIDCSDYNGNNRYRFVNTTGHVESMTIDKDVVYYSTEKPNR